MMWTWWGKEHGRRDSWRRLLGAYADGELAPQRAADVRSHLRECASCRAEVDLYFRMGEAVAELPVLAAPLTLAPAVLARTAGTVRARERRFTRILPALRLAFPTALVAALVAALRMSGLFSFLVLSVERAMHAALGGLSSYGRQLAEALGPLGKLEVLGHVSRALGNSLRTVLEAPPDGLVWAAFLAFAFVVLASALFAALRTSDKGVSHARLLV